MEDYINSRKVYGIILMLLAFIAAILQTWYFGWNRFPESREESIADVICCALFCYGMGVFSSAKDLKKFISKEE